MDFYINHFSFSVAFQASGLFEEALTEVMRIRSLLNRVGCELYVCNALTTQDFGFANNLQSAVSGLSRDKRSLVLAWIDVSRRSYYTGTYQVAGDRILICGKDASMTALGEAGYRCLNGMDATSVSARIPAWCISPLPGEFSSGSEQSQTFELPNVWNTNAVQDQLAAHRAPILTWPQLSADCVEKFTSITFAADAFDEMRRRPFCKGDADRIMELLGILDFLKRDIDSNGVWSVPGKSQYESSFIGDSAPFSDSSDSEKNEFRERLTFRHPKISDADVFSPMHGKIKTQAGPIRMHFTWPPIKGQDLIVSYIGPKLTMR